MRVIYYIIYIGTLLFILSCCESDHIESPQYFVPHTSVYLEFSDGFIVDEVSTDSCLVAFQPSTLITHDSILYSPSISRPSHNLLGIIGFHLLFYGYDVTDLSLFDNHEVLWDNINKNDHSLINQPPYKMNFLLEYITDPESPVSNRYLNSQNGNFIGGFGPPYSTDEGGLRLTNVHFSETDYNPACDENRSNAIRFKADLSGRLFNIDYSDTISVTGSFDLLIKTRN